jgi:hypothetical protein
MPKQAKTETVGFRCTADFKRQVLEIASSQSMEPSEYLHSVVENDVKKRLLEPSETEKTFIEQAFDKHTDKILSFISANVDKRLAMIESKLLPKEERIAKVIAETVSLGEAAGFRIKDETKQSWFKKLFESTSFDKDAAEIRKIVADKIKAKKEQTNTK